jgi:hypothetical protein
MPAVSVYYDILCNYIVIRNIAVNSITIMNPGELIVYFNTSTELYCTTASYRSATEE